MDVVYIDDIAIDLKPNTTIAITLQRLEIGDITKNYLSFTNTIKAPKTAKNNAAFNFANVEKSNSSYQYGYKSARIVQNGVETINGLALIKAVDNEYQINIYDDFISFNDFLGDKDLSSLDYGFQAWNNSDIDSARLNTSGFIAAVMNWGNLSNVYVKDNYLPLYFYKTLIEKIFTLTGYSLSGSILSNTDYTDLVCTPFERFKYRSGYQKTTKPTANTFDVPTTSVVIKPNFPTDNVPEGLRANVKLSINVQITFTKNVASTSKINIRLVGRTVGVFGTGPDITTNQSTTLVYQYNDVDTITSQTLEIEVVYTKDPSFPTDTVTIITNTSTTFLEVIDNLLVKRNAVQWSKLTSKAKLSDILKDFFIRFGIIYKKDLNTITLRTLEDICTDTGNAIDWTNKRVKSDNDSIAFQTSYAQINNFLHSNAAKEKFLGAGYINIANSTLPQQKDFYTSVFNNAQRWSGLGYEVMYIPVYEEKTIYINSIATGTGLVTTTDAHDLKVNDVVVFTTLTGGTGVSSGIAYYVISVTINTFTFSLTIGGAAVVPSVAYTGTQLVKVPLISDNTNDAPLSIGTLKDITNEAAITFDSTPRTDYKLAYFVDASKSKDSSFSYFLGKYYATFGRSLQQFKLCTYRYLLTDMDIASYDPHKMIYDNGSYYLINKISNYVSGKPTTVELLKIQ